MGVDALARLLTIRDRVDAAGIVKVADLAVELEVSEMTIRRDLDALAQEGVIRRIRGGGIALGPQPFAERFERQARAKEGIASKLLRLIDVSGAVGVDASSTLQRLSGVLEGARDLTIVTNGPESFTALQGMGGVTPVLTGGQLDQRTGSLVGPLTSRSIRDFSLDTVFVSAVGVDPALGTSEATLEEADAKLAFAEVSARIVVAVDSSKLGQRAPVRCLPIDRIDVLVTELEPLDTRLDPYRDLGIDIR